MALDRLVSLILRSAELVFAAIVAGVTGDYLHKSHASAWDQGRFIYTVVVAGISIFLALIWLFPFSSTFTHWPVDIFISILWWVAFGLLANVSMLCRRFMGGWLTCAAAGIFLRCLVQLGQRLAPGRPVRQIQSQPCLFVPFCHPLARVCPYWHLLDAKAGTPRARRDGSSPTPLVSPQPRLEDPTPLMLDTRERPFGLRASACQQFT